MICLSSSSIIVCVGSREGKRCDSGQVGKQVRQGSGVPMVRGRDLGGGRSTGQFWIRNQLPRPMESEWRSSTSVLVIIVRDQILIRDREI